MLLYISQTVLDKRGLHVLHCDSLSSRELAAEVVAVPEQTSRAYGGELGAWAELVVMSHWHVYRCSTLDSHAALNFNKWALEGLRHTAELLGNLVTTAGDDIDDGLGLTSRS